MIPLKRYSFEHRQAVVAASTAKYEKEEAEEAEAKRKEEEAAAAAKKKLKNFDSFFSVFGSEVKVWCSLARVC